MDLPELKVILSAAFIFIGSIVFYISSFVSGHNIYRDLSATLSATLTSIVGFLLFIFSPLSFIILFPSLFGLNEFVDPPRRLILDTHQLLFGYALLPFVLAAAGFGFLFGSVSAVKLRTLLLYWIKKKTGLRYTIYSYDITWDDFLNKVKSNREITVVAGERTYHGRLKSFSIKTEPKQLILENSHGDGDNSQDEIPQGSSDPEKGNRQILLTEFSEIREISLPPGSWSADNEVVDHPAQALYFVIAAVGFCFISTSFERTSQFLTDYKYYRLADIYSFMAIVSLCLGAFFTVISSLKLKSDNNSMQSAAVLNPHNAFITLSAILYHLYLFLHLVDDILKYSYFNVILPNFAVIVGCTALFFYLYVVRRADRLRTFFDEANGMTWQHKDGLRGLINAICEDSDFNSLCETKKRSGDHKDIIGNLKTGHYKDRETLQQQLDTLISDNNYLFGDEPQIILRLKWYLSRKD